MTITLSDGWTKRRTIVADRAKSPATLTPSSFCPFCGVASVRACGDPSLGQQSQEFTPDDVGAPIKRITDLSYNFLEGNVHRES
jgi:hypothetical protein